MGPSNNNLRRLRVDALVVCYRQRCNFSLMARIYQELRLIEILNLSPTCPLDEIYESLVRGPETGLGEWKLWQIDHDNVGCHRRLMPSLGGRERLWVSRIQSGPFARLIKHPSRRRFVLTLSKFRARGNSARMSGNCIKFHLSEKERIRVVDAN